jgi:hypothetical protein
MSEFLYTQGNELTYQDGRPYIGPYHLMPDGTPMAGNTHSGNEEVLSFVIPPNTITNINVNGFLPSGFELSDQDVIPSFETGSSFDLNRDKVEFFIYDANQNLLSVNYNFTEYTIQNDISTISDSIGEILINPDRDINNELNVEIGTYYAIYNFVTPELSSSFDNPYFISEISSDRTEIRLQNNFLSSEEIISTFNTLKNKIDSSDFFDEFYVTAGQNINYVGVNIMLDDSGEDLSILVKLYQPLPNTLNIKSQVVVISKVNETQGYEVIFTPRDLSTPITFTLRGPNVNIPLKDRVNNSTEFKTLSTLTTSSFTASFNQSQYLLNQTGISLNPSYSISDYSDFVHFSSAKKRLENFYYKAGQIESFQNSINSLRAISDPSLETTASINIFRDKISDIIENFDGFDYFLYYNSGSNAYPKLNSSPPYVLASTGSTEVLTWLGSDIVGNTYYGGALLSASRYDEDNPSNLFYTIPEYLRSNSDNQPYFDFSSMVGQHFDEIWLYARSITNKLKNTNNSETGIAPQIVEEALKSFGYEVYGNNFNNSDIFTGLIGINESGDYFPETGEEVINTFVTASNEPTSIDSVSKEIYKRLYHNLVYLAKRKGTISGLRSLINIWGLPDTILRINEFGGKDKVNTNDWDLYRRIYNKEVNSYIVDADLGRRYNGGIETVWKLNPNWSSSAAISNLTGSVPSTVEFRFKSDINPSTTPSQSIPLQPLWGLRDNTGDNKVLVYLEYKGSGSFSGSFNGSSVDPNNQYANLTLAISGSPSTSASISLPFYNQDWWNVRVQMQELGLAGVDQARYQIASANKIYNGKDGTKIGFTGSIKHNAISGSWVNSTTSSFGLGRTFNSVTYPNFSGSLQEVRYWTLCFNNDSNINEGVWDNHVMDPLSIETGYLTESLSPTENLVFRTREGEDLSLISGSQGNLTVLTSIHPKVTGSFLLTSSFADNSSYNLITSSISNNSEIQFLNQPNLGIKNRVSDKIKDYNNVAYGEVLSSYRSIQQNYEASQSFTDSTNLLEVAFSPQDEINDDITHEFGFTNKITDQLADPRNLSSSLDYYDGLRDIALKYFEKYIKADPTDYFRLIKFIDNSLFKAIKNYVPARTSVSTGIVVKQHLLERNRVKPPQVSANTKLAVTPETGSTIHTGFQTGFNSPLMFENISLSGSIASQPRNYITGSPVQVFSGGTGGSLEKFNSIDFSPYGPSGSGPVKMFGFEITQSFSESISTLSGSIYKTRDQQFEFYNGEFSGSSIVVTTQSLNAHCEPFLNVSITPPTTASFDKFIYEESITLPSRFNNVLTEPNSGQILIAGNTVLNGFRMTKLKISKTTKGGLNINNLISNATRLNFEFGGVDVEKLEETANSITFDLPVTQQFPLSITSSNFENYPFIADKSSSQNFQNISSTTNPTLEFTNIITDYTSETDPNNLFGQSTGIYNTPQTPNTPIQFTGSVNFTASFENFGNFNDIKFILGVEGTDAITTTDSVTYTTSSANQNLSGSLSIQGISDLVVPLKTEQISLAITTQHGFFPNNAFVSSSFTASAVSFAFNTGSINDTDSVSELGSFEPLSNGFDHAFDCQPLLNNVLDIRPGTLYLDVDYSTGLITPTNITVITNNDQTLDPALTPDSNYTQKSRTLLRYEGSKLSSAKLNFFTGPNEIILSDGTPWRGDISFGKEPVIDRTKPNFGYLQLLVPTSPELEDATQVKLKYIIDKEGKPFKPLLNSPSFFDVEGTFETGDKVDIALENTLQTDDPSLTNAAVGINLDNFNTEAEVIRGARRVDPILTTQIVSINDVTTTNSAFNTHSLSFASPIQTSNDYSFQAGEFSVKTYDEPIIGVETYVVSASNEGYDFANNYTPTTSTFLNPTPSIADETPIKFQFQGNVTATDCNAVLSIARNRGGSIVELPGTSFIFSANAGGGTTQFERFSFDYDPSATQPILDTGFLTNLDLVAGDQIFVRLRIFGNGTSGGSIQIQDANFYGVPSERGTVETTGSFWFTGSANDIYLTSSFGLGSFLNFRQVQDSGSTFKPINEPFIIKVGDEFRFNGLENRSHLVNDVLFEGGKVIAKVHPPVREDINLDQFLIRRYNSDGTSVLIDLIPPSSSFSTTKGVIKNISVDEELEKNINNILSKLSEEGTI